MSNGMNSFYIVDGVLTLLDDYAEAASQWGTSICGNSNFVFLSELGYPGYDPAYYTQGLLTYGAKPDLDITSQTLVTGRTFDIVGISFGTSGLLAEFVDSSSISHICLIVSGYTDVYAQIIVPQEASYGSGVLTLTNSDDSSDSIGLNLEFELSADIEEPGNPKGEWDATKTYTKNDLVYLVGDPYGWYIAKQDPIELDANYKWRKRSSTNINKYPRTNPTYWKQSSWKNIVPSIVEGDTQRLQSFEQQLVDNILKSLGIPEWFYFELSEHSKNRLLIAQIFQFLIKLRGTPRGFRSMLNLVGLDTNIGKPLTLSGGRKEPEEIATYNFSYQQAKQSTDIYPRLGQWDETHSYSINDVVFKEVYIPGEYIGCNTYISLVDSNLNNIPDDDISTPEWTLAGKLRTQIGDNSYYDIIVTGFNYFGDDLCIDDLSDQYKSSKYLSEILRFMIPSYIRYDAILELCNSFYHLISHSYITAYIFDLEEDNPPYSLIINIYSGIFDEVSGIVTIDGNPSPKIDVQPNVSIEIIATPSSGYYFEEWEVLGYFGKDNYGSGMINEWQSDTSYVVGDYAWDKFVNKMFVCTTNHTSAPDIYPNQDTINWYEENIKTSTATIMITHGSAKLRAKFLKS